MTTSHPGECRRVAGVSPPARSYGSHDEIWVLNHRSSVVIPFIMV